MLINSTLGLMFVLAQTQPSDKFLELKHKLETYDFIVKIEPPPIRGTYGLLKTKSKTIWINPVVFDLRIALPTLIHEATHAAQLCTGKGKIFPLN